MRPAALAPTISTIPDDLTRAPQWVVWRYGWRETDGEGKWTKPPYNARTGAIADSTDPATWTTFAETVATYTRGGWDGIGRVLTRDYTGVDLDHCRDPRTGTITPEAQTLLERLDSYTEVTPSACGVRIWLRGALPPGRRRMGCIELYDAGRFFTVTGHRVAGTPRTIEARPAELAALHAELFPASESPRRGPAEPPALDDEAIIDAILRSRAGARFARLWDGEWEALGYASHSEADLALCSLIAFFTGSDAPRVDHFFRRSRLYRDKWDHQRGALTYGARTLERAVTGR